MTLIDNLTLKLIFLNIYYYLMIETLIYISIICFSLVPLIQNSILPIIDYYFFDQLYEKRVSTHKVTQ
jgi:hypothetical protein